MFIHMNQASKIHDSKIVDFHSAPERRSATFMKWMVDDLTEQLDRSQKHIIRLQGEVDKLRRLHHKSVEKNNIITRQLVYESALKESCLRALEFAMPDNSNFNPDEYARTFDDIRPLIEEYWHGTARGISKSLNTPIQGQ